MQKRGTKDAEGVYCFVCEWFDMQSETTKQFLLSYYAQDETIDMFDLNMQRLFLKRCPYPSIQLRDLRVGNQVSIYARQLKIIEYGDEFTIDRLGEANEKCVVVVRPNAMHKLGQVLDYIASNQFLTMQAKTLNLTDADASGIFGPQGGGLTGGTCCALLLEGQDINSKLSFMSDAAYISTSEQSEKLAKSLFSKGNTTAQFGNSTVCVVKPTSIRVGSYGKIIDQVSQSFNITALEMFYLDRVAAAEFLEVYRGVVPEYNAMLEEFTTGSIIAMELTSKNGGEVVQQFRDLCGPPDPDVAKAIRPNSLRAQFGQDKVKNAVHCTDLVEDGPLDSEFFFNIQQREQLVRGPHGNFKI